MAKPSVWLHPQEQAVLDRVVVRLVAPDEKVRWDDPIITRHYLKNATRVGEQLRYVAELDGQWLALLGWSAAAYHLKGRDARIGWSVEQRRRRLHLLANNARFLVLLTEPDQLPNLPTRVLALGCMSCFTRVAEDFHVAHDRPKTLYARPRHKRAAQWLRRPQLPPDLAPFERAVPPRCRQHAGQLEAPTENCVYRVLSTVPIVELGQALVEDQGGDYVLRSKGNQAGRQRQAQTLLPASVPPPLGTLKSKTIALGVNAAPWSPAAWTRRK